VAELHKGCRSLQFPQYCSSLRLSYHHGTKETQDFFLRVSIYRGKNGKIWEQKHLQKYFFQHTLDGEVHMLIS
jgi:hypothetical protein